MIDSNTTVRTHIVRRVRRGLLRSRHPRRGALPRLPTALGVSGFVAPPYYAYIVWHVPALTSTSTACVSVERGVDRVG
jgi:hypothetical protein